MPTESRVQRVAELKRVHAEGGAARVGALNPYHGQIVLAAVWRGGYRRMLDELAANSPARRRWAARGPDFGTLDRYAAGESGDGKYQESINRWACRD
jgi:hypothetical protein